MLCSDYVKKTKPAVVNRGEDREIKSAYAGDFLSFVMARAGEGCIWFTVMNNINVAGVASLTGCSCVVICDGIKADLKLTEKSKAIGLTLLETEKPVYEACAEFSGL